MAESHGWVHRKRAANGLQFHTVEAGEGPLVLLLHGFPEHWYSWREQVEVLADAGFHVVAPDMRGYNRTEKPTGIDAYHVDELVADVAGLIGATGHESARVVGHDWGGFVAWETAMCRPDLVDQLVSVGVTHPACFDRALDRVSQFARAWYMYFFQFPRLPEWGMRVNDYAAHERMIRDLLVNSDAFDQSDFETYREAIARPGALTGMVNYYRANTGGNFLRKLCYPRIGQTGVPTTTFTTSQVTVPAMVLWGAQDIFDEHVMFDRLGDWVTDLRRERFPDASHWPQLERPERTNDMLVEFLDD